MVQIASIFLNLPKIHCSRCSCVCRKLSFLLFESSLIFNRFKVFNCVLAFVFMIHSICQVKCDLILLSSP